MIPFNLQLFSQEKTEKATPRKKQEVRKKGQVAKSNEVSGAVILLGLFLCFLIWGKTLRGRLWNLFHHPLTHYLQMPVTEQNIIYILKQTLFQMMELLLPFFITAMIFGLVSHWIQFGFLFSTEPLQFKMGKLNPIKGLKNIISIRALVELVKSLAKVSLIGFLVYQTLWTQKEALISLSYRSVQDIFLFSTQTIFSLGLKVAVALGILASLDYLYRRYEYAKQNRMSKQEIKDEYKKTEGDPLIKSRIKERQRRMATQRMMQMVPKADVIVTNPTHYAVALQYESSKMDAPKVVAKGKDFVALKIREIAEKHNVVIMEHKPLARALYRETEPGDYIPSELFHAVAEILAYVYKARGRSQG